MREGTGVVSTQVLQEYANVALTKLKQEDSILLRILRLLEALTVVQTTPLLIRRAVELRKVRRMRAGTGSSSARDWRGDVREVVASS
ncbi:MAG: hypothetical protein QME60_09360 [Verrucomicrobiota bacterium]|nr:hypothetical protein [Verrucomicrobiota bacterium]